MASLYFIAFRPLPTNNKILSVTSFASSPHPSSQPINQRRVLEDEIPW